MLHVIKMLLLPLISNGYIFVLFKASLPVIEQINNKRICLKSYVLSEKLLLGTSIGFPHA